MARPRIAIVDDHQMLCQSFAVALATDCEVVGTATSGDEFLALLRCTQIDCVLLDLQMPGKSGLGLLPEMRTISPATKALIVTMYVDRAIAEEAFRLGAAGFIPKDASIEELLAAIQEVVAGGRYLSPRVPKATHRIGLRAHHPGLAGLTPRQHQIFVKIGEGKSWTEIADELPCGPSTLTFHKQKIMERLGLQTDSELRRFACILEAELSVAEDLEHAIPGD